MKRGQDLTGAVVKGWDHLQHGEGDEIQMRFEDGRTLTVKAKATRPPVFPWLAISIRQPR